MNYKKYKPTLHLMVGLPCSGKTTKAKELAKKHHAVLFSPDVWMIEIFGQYSGDEHDARHTKIENIMIKVTLESLKNDVNVVLDFGCWTKEERDALREKATSAGANFIMHFMSVPKEELLNRIEKRNANLPSGTFYIEKSWIEEWIPLLQTPSKEELSYTKIYYPLESIGECNIFMQCDKVDESAFSNPPKGYSIRLCKENELKTWAKIAGGEYWEYVIDYYNRAYLPRAKEFFKRCTFVVDENNKPVSTCFLWKSYEKITTIGWFRTLPEYEGRGIGRALLSHLLKEAKTPIFLHTHPVLFRAIRTYANFGFKFVKSDFIGYRSNDLDECLEFIKDGMGKWYNNIETALPKKSLLSAALSNIESEF